MNTASTSDNGPDQVSGISVVYDGECPFCSRYVAMLRLRKAAGQVDLIDARTPHPLIDEVLQHGFDIDDGMVAKIGDAYYAGAECMHVLSLLSTRADSFNRINYWIFRSRILSRTLYPVLRFGRNTTLRLLGIKKIGRSAGQEPLRGV